MTTAATYLLGGLDLFVFPARRRTGITTFFSPPREGGPVDASTTIPLVSRQLICCFISLKSIYYFLLFLSGRWCGPENLIFTHVHSHWPHLRLLLLLQGGRRRGQRRSQKCGNLRIESSRFTPDIPSLSDPIRRAYFFFFSAAHRVL
ncbi:hypothetical protein BHM03_00013645 [Ensete ventricosum]|uniref:Uncharacterized protein n=1 Tax=Ensete ventricosum TaxID=4639 RepID=A0A427A6X2_ENSVE|nr:hypothetical protein B296_00005732 [Ensete ventricosum]RZR86454.1 hypothetical protein BHM03_00013645 [Ensete ventricosum]